MGTSKRRNTPTIVVQKHRDKKVIRIRFWRESGDLFDVRVRLDDESLRTSAARNDYRDDVKAFISEIGPERFAGAWPRMNGDPLNPSVFEAEAAERRREEEAARAASIPTVGLLVDHYLQHYVSPPVADADGDRASGLKTWKRVECHVRVIERMLGRSLPLSELTYERVRQLKLARLREPLERGGGSRTLADVHRTLAVLRRMINVAITHRPRWMSRDDDPFLAAVPKTEKLIRVSKEKRREQTLSLSDEKRVLSELKGNDPLMRTLIVMLLDTGARVGEVITVIAPVPRRRGSDPARAIRKGSAARPLERIETYTQRQAERAALTAFYRRVMWSDIDFANGTITIHASKTETVRRVGITPRLRAELEQLRRQRTADAADEVFAGLSYPRARKEWHHACRRAGVRPIGLHQLRHTCARRWALGGLPEPLIADLLGHAKKTDAVTQRYIGGADESVIKMARLAAERFRRQATKGGHGTEAVN